MNFLPQIYHLKKMGKFIFVFLSLICFTNLCSCSRPLERHSYQNRNYHAINRFKIVSYVLKTGDSFQIKTVPAKNLAFRPLAEWIAQGIFDGENYNTTG